MPTIVLSGNSRDGRRLAERFAQGRGWLRKDATAGEIGGAIDRALTRRVWRWSAAIVAILLVLAVLVIAITWYALRARG